MLLLPLENEEELVDEGGRRSERRMELGINAV